MLILKLSYQCMTRMPPAMRMRSQNGWKRKKPMSTKEQEDHGVDDSLRSKDVPKAEKWYASGGGCIVNKEKWVHTNWNSEHNLLLNIRAHTQDLLTWFTAWLTFMWRFHRQVNLKIHFNKCLFFDMESIFYKLSTYLNESKYFTVPHAR